MVLRQTYAEEGESKGKKSKENRKEKINPNRESNHNKGGVYELRIMRAEKTEEKSKEEKEISF